ncbi:hypothetical protein MTP99_004689 [Tenebrio molitor]|nr:hypothetical protein MTP99_004689 [Tenebrio molitor]
MPIDGPRLPQKDPPIQSRESNVAYSVAAISLFLPPPGAECDRFAATNASSRVRHSAEERRPEERRPWHRQVVERTPFRRKDGGGDEHRCGRNS